MRVICVDDEKPVLDNFARKVKDISLVESLELFQDAEQVVEWVAEHKVDVAFLDVEMPMVNGIELARRMKKIDEDIRKKLIKENIPVYLINYHMNIKEVLEDYRE